jgi:exoribonuclease R
VFAEADRIDLTDVPFVTIDPAGSTDLDQAVHARRRPSGFELRYAIADVARFVDPGGPIDTEARSRGTTKYLPDGRVPLHPQILSEGAASLLADQTRPAAVWTFALDEGGEVRSVRVERALVRSRAKLAYDDVQRRLDDGSADGLLRAVAEVGRLRQALAADRGGVDLPVPEQNVDHDDAGWHLTFRSPQPIEGWNAQISLMTGMAAADLMLAGGIGVLRTMPPPDHRDLARVRRTAEALGLSWPQAGGYAALIRNADPGNPKHLAFLSLATTLLRGAGYTPFDGEPPEHTTHSAVAAPYAHVTAPLRRLVDRFGTEVALAVHAGAEVPHWAREALPLLPELMTAATRTSRALERESLNLLEAVLLADRVGEAFGASVVDGDGKAGFTVVIPEPAVRAKADGPLEVGTRADVVLALADPGSRTVRFRANGAVPA